MLPYLVPAIIIGLHRPASPTTAKSRPEDEG